MLLYSVKKGNFIIEDIYNKEHNQVRNGGHTYEKALEKFME